MFPTVRKAGLIVVIFALWIAGVAWWNSPGPSEADDPILGEWTNSLVGSQLIVHADGTFEQFASGRRSLGSWKTIKAWRLDSVIGMRPVLPYHADGDFEISSLSRDWKGSIRRIEHAYLFEEPGIEEVVVPIQDKDGIRLEGNEIHWNYQRPSFWSSWLADFTIPGIAP